MLKNKNKKFYHEFTRDIFGWKEDAWKQHNAAEEIAAKGEEFIIAKDDKPIDKVVPFVQQDTVQKRIGFLKGKIEVPADFDEMGQNEISLFEDITRIKLDITTQEIVDIIHECRAGI